MKKKRLLSMLCAGMMLFASVLPQLPYDDMNVSAAYDDVYTYGDFEYKDMYGSIYITAYTGTNKFVTIPNTINGKKVTYFYADVFAGNEDIESITIPANIDVIPDGAFYGCTSLKQFTSHNSKYSFSNGFLYYIRPDYDKHISTTVSNSKISSNTDKNSSNYNEKVDGALTSYQVELEVKKSVIYYTKDLQYVTVPEGVDDIAPYAFAGRAKMTHIILPAGIKRIGERAFWGCSELRGMSMTNNGGEYSEFNIPYETVVIEKAAFVGCYSIRNVNFPNTLEAIGQYAFASGMNLKSVYIPPSVKIIGDYAFGATAGIYGNSMNCQVHCETIVLVSDSETDEDGVPCAALAYALTNRENFSETESYNGGETDEDGNTVVTVQNYFGTESYTITEPPVTHDPNNDFDHTYILTACVPVTCTSPGAIAGICICGHTYYQEFPALGHSFTEEVTVDPTCTEDGYTGMKCIRCDEVYESGGMITPVITIPDKEIIPALGHSYGTPIYEWSEDHSTCTATSFCEHDDSHVITENGTVTSKKDGDTTVYTAAFTNKRFTTQTVKVKDGTVVQEPASGDSNGDGEFNISDVVILQKWLLAVPDTQFADWRAANFYPDDRLDVFDLCLMKRALIYGTQNTAS